MWARRKNADAVKRGLYVSAPIARGEVQVFEKSEFEVLAQVALRPYSVT